MKSVSPLQDFRAGSQRQRRNSSSGGFTLIEIMVVVAIIGIIMTMSVPSLVRMMNPKGLAKAVDDVVQACVNARAQAILSGKPTELIFHPIDKGFEITGGSAMPSLTKSDPTIGHFDDDITIELLFINLREFTESDTAHIRFFPDGTCDEMTLILLGPNNERRKISLEVITSLVRAGPIDK